DERRAARVLHVGPGELVLATLVEDRADALEVRGAVRRAVEAREPAVVRAPDPVGVRRVDGEIGVVPGAVDRGVARLRRGLESVAGEEDLAERLAGLEVQLLVVPGG